MKKIFTLIGIALLTFTITACNQESTPEEAAAPQAAAVAPTPESAQAAGVTGTVVETMDASGYTYVQVDSGSEKVWAAAPKFQVAVGDTVVIPEGMAMNNFSSKTLNRTFEVIYFVDSILNASAGDAQAAPMTDASVASMPEGHPATNVAAPQDVDFSSLQKPEGGMTVGEIFSSKDDLAGKEVTLRAKVVKFNQQIMGKNWLHLQDGSGDASAGTHDLTATSDVAAKVGDTVLVSGLVTLDKDFGYGYKYNVIIEDAKISVE